MGVKFLCSNGNTIWWKSQNLDNLNIYLSFIFLGFRLFSSDTDTHATLAIEYDNLSDARDMEDECYQLLFTEEFHAPPLVADLPVEAFVGIDPHVDPHAYDVAMHQEFIRWQELSEREADERLLEDIWEEPDRTIHLYADYQCRSMQHQPDIDLRANELDMVAGRFYPDNDVDTESDDDLQSAATPVRPAKRTRAPPPLLAAHNLRRSLEKAREPPRYFCCVCCRILYADDTCPLKVPGPANRRPNLDEIEWPSLQYGRQPTFKNGTRTACKAHQNLDDKTIALVGGIVVLYSPFSNEACFHHFYVFFRCTCLLS